MSQGKSCPFCGIGDEAGYLAATEYTLVRYPLDPAIRYHLLVIPKRHITHLDEMTAAEAADLYRTFQRIVAAAKQQLGDSFIGYNLLSNNGDARINQRVDHAHLHLFLRLDGEPGNPLANKHTGQPQPITAAQKAIAAKVREWLTSALA